MSASDLPLSDRLEQQRLQMALRESEVLREMAELLASSLDLEKILQVLARRTVEVCEVERCAVWLLEDARGIFRPKTYHITSPHLTRKTIKAADKIWYHTPLPFDDPVIHRLLKEPGMLYVEDLQKEHGLKQVAETFFVRSVLLIALIREGRPVGMLSLDNPGSYRTFSPEQQQLARAIGQQAAMAIDNARLYQQAQSERKRAEQLIQRARSVYQVASTINASEDLATIFETAMSHLIRGLDANSGAIALLQKDTLRLEYISKSSLNLADAPLTVQLIDLPNCRHAASTGESLYVTEEQVEGDEIHWYRKLGFCNTMIIPLMINTSANTLEDAEHASRCVGLAFINYHKTHAQPSKGQFAYAQDIAAQCALAIEKVRLLAEVRQSAAVATQRASTLDAIFHAMTEGITVADMNGSVLVLNNAAAHFLGVPKNFRGTLQAFLRRYPTYTLDGQMISEEEFPLSRALRGERIRAERFITRRADGEERILEINIASLNNSAEQQIGVVSAFRDITESIRAEQRTRQALDTMLHVAEAVSGITDIKDILRSVLERTLTTLNCLRGAVLLHDTEQGFSPFLSTGFVDEDEERRWQNDQQAWLEQTSDSTHTFHHQLMAGNAMVIDTELCAPNSLNHTSVLVAPITHNNSVHGLILLDGSLAMPASEQQEKQEWHEFTVWDMAVVEGIAQMAGLAIEQARWQQEAIEARAGEAAMREANALKDEFLAITAHEFRSPLTVILAQAQLVARNLSRLPETVQEEQKGVLQKAAKNLAVVEEQTRQLTDIVKTFLEVTHLNRGKLTLNMSEVNLEEIAQQVVAQSSATTHAHTLNCLVEQDEKPYLVYGDAARLQQIVANLVENAIKYSPFGGPITVSLRHNRSPEGAVLVEVSIEDKGIGVPLESQPRLFERFYRAPNTLESKTKGVGLGLYIVAQLLRLQGGTIRVESSGVFGEGSRFIFTLPIVERSERAA